MQLLLHPSARNNISPALPELPLPSGPIYPRGSLQDHCAQQFVLDGDISKTTGSVRDS